MALAFLAALTPTVSAAVMIAAEGPNLATIGTFLGGAGVTLGVVATFVARKDTKRTSELQMAQTIQQQNYDHLKEQHDSLVTSLATANGTIEDLRERDRTKDGQYIELERRHHECERGRRSLETQLAIVQMAVEELKRDRDR
jgi:hypothetical protein